MDGHVKAHIEFCRDVRSRGLIEHTSALGGKRVQYFTGNSFLLFLMKNKDKLGSPPEGNLDSMPGVIEYGNTLINNKVMLKCMGLPKGIKRPK